MPDQLGRQHLEPIRLPLGFSALDGDILPLKITQLVQALIERLEGSVRGEWTKVLKDDAFCIPENLGHTTTYKVEDY